MRNPTPEEIEDAYQHGQWLRGVGPLGAEPRMLADLSVEVANLRADKATLRETIANLIRYSCPSANRHDPSLHSAVRNAIDVIQP